MRFNILLITMLFFSTSALLIGSRDLDIVIFDNIENSFYYTGCIVRDKKTSDTLLELTFFNVEYYNNYYINENYFYHFCKCYQGTYNPPFHELLVSRYDVLLDTIKYNNSFSFGHYADSVSSKFEKNKITVFKGDSIIEFDLDKWQIINIYVK